MYVPGSQHHHNGREEAAAIAMGPGPWGPRTRPEALGASLLDFLPGVSDTALQQMAQKSFDYTWPLAEEKLKPYLYVTVGVAAVAYLGLVWLIVRRG